MWSTIIVVAECGNRIHNGYSSKGSFCPISAYIVIARVMLVLLPQQQALVCDMWCVGCATCTWSVVTWDHYNDYLPPIP